MSKYYVIYFLESGEIHTVGYGRVDVVRKSLNPGEGLIEDSEAYPLDMVHYSTHKVVNGEVVEK